MIEKKFYEVYNKFKLNYYQNVLSSKVRKEANLTISEAFCAELINALDEPTVGELVKILKISQPNITYRVNSLVKKGYIEKINSKVDKRIVHLKVTEKYKNYQKFKNSYAIDVIRRTEENLGDEEKEVFEKILVIMDKNFISSNKKDYHENK